MQSFKFDFTNTHKIINMFQFPIEMIKEIQFRILTKWQTIDAKFDDIFLSAQCSIKIAINCYIHRLLQCNLHVRGTRYIYILMQTAALNRVNKCVIVTDRF